MKLIYIAYGNVSVFESQIVALWNYFIENNKVKKLIVILGINYKDDFIKHNNCGLSDHIQIEYYKHYPQYPVIEQLTIASISKALKNIVNLSDYVIHVRNDVLTHYVYKSLISLGEKTDNLIAYILGAVLEQILEYSNKNIFLKKLKINQRKRVFQALQKIGSISGVSECLKIYVKNRLGELKEIPNMPAYEKNKLRRWRIWFI